MLAKANSAYVEAESGHPAALPDLGKLSADVAKAEEDLAKARASCISARDRLAKLNFAEGRPKSHLSGLARATPEAAAQTAQAGARDAGIYRDGAGASGSGTYAARVTAETGGHRAAPGQRSAPTTVAPPDFAQPALNIDGSAETPMKGRATAGRSGTAPVPFPPDASPGSKQAASARDPRGWRTLGWQTAQLSILTLAYLQYYFIDVNLQIAMLPSPVLPGLLAG